MNRTARSAALCLVGVFSVLAVYVASDSFRRVVRSLVREIGFESALEASPSSAAVSAQSGLPETAMGSAIEPGSSGALWEAQRSFEGAVARGFDRSDAIDQAGEALEFLAANDPELAVAHLYALPPARRGALVTALSRGWARADPLGAWEFAEYAWVEREGGFIDRDLQTQMYRSILDATLREQRDFRTALGLVVSTIEPDVKQTLAKQLATTVVALGATEALDSLDLEADPVTDIAIMDAVVDEWAKADALGASYWATGNPTQISEIGLRSIARGLFLEGESTRLSRFYSSFDEGSARDAIAAETARLSARAQNGRALEWLGAISSKKTRLVAVLDSTRELGHYDFGLTTELIDGAFVGSDPNRLEALRQSLSRWVKVDSVVVESYLDSGAVGLDGDDLSEFRSEIGLK